MTQFLEYALKYAELGWQIFPIVPRQKVPLTAHGVKDATLDADQIRAWWTKWPNANIAVACGQASGVYVVDVDVSEAGDVNGLKSLVTEFDPLPATIQQYTPRGGFHAFYRTNNPPANRNSFRSGIDIRGDGYYVVVAPSIHPNGGQYIWKEGCSPWEIQPNEFPNFMRPTTKAPWSAATSEHKVAKAFDDAMWSAAPVAPASVDILQRASLYLAECEAAVQGCGGHDKLLWAAIAMVHGFLLTDDQAFDVLAREYNPRCVPPWDLSMTTDGRDFKRKVTEARKLTPEKPRGWLLQDDTYTSTPIDPAQVAAVKELIEKANIKQKPTAFISTPIGPNPYRETFELDFLTHPTGLLGEICEWINKTAIRKQPILTLACALTFCGALFGRKIRDSLGSRTNLYCMGIAKSSAGKAHAPNQIRKLCNASGCAELLGGDDVASDSGIEDRMERNPTTLFLWDEIGFLLSHIRSGISQHHSRIISHLMKLYSASGSIFKGREYAEFDRQRTIIQPCCCLYGTSTPERFIEGISPEELQDGWLSRCIVFRTYSHPPKDRNRCDAPPPECICKQVATWYARQIGITDGRDISQFAAYNGVTGTTIEQPPEQIVVPKSNEAEKFFVSLDNESNIYGKQYPQLACLWAKAEENARKIALILAASESFDSPNVTAANADYACRLIRYSLLAFGRETVPSIVTCSTDAKKQKLLKVIDKGGVDGCSKRDVTRGSQWTNAKERNALLADLIEAEEIIAQIKDKTVYFWTVKNYRKEL